MAKVEINKDYCKSCRLCINVCPKQVLFVGKYTNKMGYDAVEMDETKGVDFDVGNRYQSTRFYFIR